MTVPQIFAGGRFFDVTGSGYEPNGEVLADRHRAARHRLVALRHRRRPRHLLCIVELEKWVRRKATHVS